MGRCGLRAGCRGVVVGEGLLSVVQAHQPGDLAARERVGGGRFPVGAEDFADLLLGEGDLREEVALRLVGCGGLGGHGSADGG